MYFRTSWIDDDVNSGMSILLGEANSEEQNHFAIRVINKTVNTIGWTNVSEFKIS